MSYKELTEGFSERAIQEQLINRKKVEKWESKGLLEGLKGTKKTQMARLLENEAKYLFEASDTGDIKGFQSIAFPLVRRVYGQLLAQEICSVQPMSLPAGLIFWMDFTMGSNKAGTGYQDWFGGTTRSLGGDPIVPLTGGANGTGGHYYMANSYTQLEATGTVAIASSASVTAWSEVEYDFELSAAVANSGLHKLTVDLDDDAAITNIDETNFKSFAVSGTAAALGATTVLYRRHSQYNPTTKVLTMYYSGTALVGGGANSGSSVTVSYVKKTAHAGDTSGTTLTPAFEYTFNNTDPIPQIEIKIASHPVVAQDRKLKVVWTPELAQDLNAYHAIDAEAELTQMMADQVALDIDAELLVDMVNKAFAGGVKLYWDRRPGFFVNKDTGAPLAGLSFTGNQQEWYAGLLETMTDCSNQLLRRNLRSGATFCVISPEIATILENIVQYRPAMDVGDTASLKFSMGIEKTGTLGQRWQVYKAPFFIRNVILLGIKGTEWLTTSYVYAPYIPLIVTPVIHDPTNFTPAKGVMTRYAKQCVRADHFGLVIVKGMEIY